VESFLAFVPLEWTFAQEWRWRDVLDVALMTFIVYQAYIRFRGTRAARVGAGLATLGLLYVLAQAAGLLLTSWVLSGIWAAAFILLIIVFQNEIRQMLEYVYPLLPSLAMFRRIVQVKEATASLAPIAETCFMLAAKRYGALLVFEQHDPLEPSLRSHGALIDAQISPQLIENLATPPTPLHDGALYLRNGRLYRAGCILPLSETRSLPYFYGTRHRAAVGITERSDALAVVVSEERGTVSAVERGAMVMMPDTASLVSWLTARLASVAPQRIMRWPGRTLVTYNWQAKLGALAVVSVLWLVLVGPQNTEVGFTVPIVYYNIPAELELDGKRTQEVYLRLRGSRELLSLLDTRRVRAQLDLKDAQEGSTRYSLSAQDVNVPLGLQVAGVDPAALTVRLKKKPPPEKSTEKEGGSKEPAHAKGTKS
jgi:diadenylate cyclase